MGTQDFPNEGNPSSPPTLINVHESISTRTILQLKRKGEKKSSPAKRRRVSSRRLHTSPDAGSDFDYNNKNVMVLGSV
eukprot:259546-Amorphochlora_amoeboformis.AAC.1